MIRKLLITALLAVSTLLGWRYYLKVTEPTQIVPIPIATLVYPVGTGFPLRAEKALGYQGVISTKTEKFVIVSPPARALELKALVDDYNQQHPVDLSQAESVHRGYFRESYQTPRNWTKENSVVPPDDEMYPQTNPDDIILTIYWDGINSKRYYFSNMYRGQCPTDIRVYNNKDIKMRGQCTEEEKEQIRQDVARTWKQGRIIP